MPLKLIVMRHAKSSWQDKSLDDFDRPLNDRGRRSAEALGHWLRRQGHIPEAVVHSSSQRTTETWERIAPRFPNAHTESTRALYLATPRSILRVVRAQTATSVLVIAHNPGIAQFAADIAATHPDHEGFFRYPTGATAVLTFEGSAWPNINWSEGTVIDFVVPRELTD